MAGYDAVGGLGGIIPGMGFWEPAAERRVGGCLHELHSLNQFVLGFGHDKSVVYRAGVVILCVIACMQQEQLDRVVSSAESSAFRTDGNEQVRNTESEKRVEAERAD